jgi:hypothetical protein
MPIFGIGTANSTANQLGRSGHRQDVSPKEIFCRDASGEILGVTSKIHSPPAISGENASNPIDHVRARRYNRAFQFSGNSPRDSNQE